MDFDDTITRILLTIQVSDLSDTQKADCYAQLDLGLHRLVWPILVSHISENDLKDVVDHPEDLTVKRYSELMSQALDDPATAPEIHAEVMGALTEIESLIATQLPKPPKP